MKTIPPAQTEQQLTAVADRFDEWRQTRTTRAEPIPQSLWEQAIALTATFLITRVAMRLRVSGGELKKRCTAHHAAAPPPSATVDCCASSALRQPAGAARSKAQCGLDRPRRMSQGEASRVVRGEGLGKGGFGRLRGALLFLTEHATAWCRLPLVAGGKKA